MNIETKNLCRIFYLVALADNKLLANEFDKLNEQMESVISNMTEDIAYDESILAETIKDLNSKALIVSPNGNIENIIEYFLISSAESIQEHSLRETIINQCFTIALADNELAFEESQFIKKLATLWGLSDLYDSSLRLSGIIN